MAVTMKNRIPPLKKGQLTKFGYSTKKTARTRHTAINKAVRKYGPLSMYRKLNVLAIYNKNKHKRTAKIAKSDRNYIGKLHGYKHT